MNKDSETVLEMTVSESLFIKCPCACTLTVEKEARAPHIVLNTTSFSHDVRKSLSSKIIQFCLTSSQYGKESFATLIVAILLNFLTVQKNSFYSYGFQFRLASSRYKRGSFWPWRAREACNTMKMQCTCALNEYVFFYVLWRVVWAKRVPWKAHRSEKCVWI